MTTDSVDLESRKDEIIDPVALRFGIGQNYRCTTAGSGWVSRPQKADKWRDGYLKFIRKPKEEGGLGLGNDALSIHFSHRLGVDARKNYIEGVNAGKFRKPRRNWDEKFTKEVIVDFTGIDDKQPRQVKLPAGLPSDELEKRYPQLYETRASRAGAGREEAPMLGEDDLEAVLEGEPSEDEMRTTLETDMEDETFMAEEGEESAVEGEEVEEELFAVTATAQPSTEVEETDLDDILVDSTQPGESAAQASERGELSGAAAARHKQKEETGSGRIEEFDQPREMQKKTVRAKLPASLEPEVVKGPWIRVMDSDGEERDFYKIKHPQTKDIMFIQEGKTEIDGWEVNLIIVEE